MDKEVAAFWVIVLALVCLFVGAVGGGAYVGNDMKIKAIAHGAAHYVVNQQTGETKFEWVNKAEERK